MNQNKRIPRNLLVVLAVIATIAVIGIVAYAFQPASTDGQITVIAPNFVSDGNDEARLTALDQLLERINYAKARRDETAIGQGGPLPFWASQGVHDTFNTAIRAAEDIYVRTGMFAPGEEFDVPVRIDGNLGFSSMMLRLNIPPELELVKINPGSAFSQQFQPPNRNWNPDTKVINPPMTGNILAGWGGGAETGSNDFSANGVMLTYTLRVRSNAAVNTTTAPITITFANNVDYEFPVRMHTDPTDGHQVSTPLTMSIQGTTIATLGQVVELGRVRIVEIED
jgi:hypothetical protein